MQGIHDIGLPLVKYADLRYDKLVFYNYYRCRYRQCGRNMKILVYGCGVIGSYLVHKLCEAGNDVTVAARGKWKETLETKGLMIRHKLSRKNTLDHPRVIDAAEETEAYDLVISVMQGQQQEHLLPILAKVNAPLVILVGNNPRAAQMEAELHSIAGDDRKILFGFQGTAGVREADQVTCVSPGSGSMTVGGLHEEPDTESKQTLLAAFGDTGYQLHWTDDMEGWLWCHVAFILPIVYLSYSLDCDLTKAGSEEIAAVVSAAEEGYRLIAFSGMKIRPESDEMFFNSEFKKAAVRRVLWIVAKTSLGKLCATDHCRNAVSEMEWLDQQFEQLKGSHPDFPMPVWNELRSRMPAWDVLHQTYDREAGAALPVKADYANWMPKEMVAGTALGSGALLAAGVLTVKNAAKRGSGSGKLAGAVLLAGAAGCGAFSVYSAIARRAFSYDGERKLSKQIIEGIAAYVNIPEGGTCLDVGCGSGALTIACAKRNPGALIVGMDHWGPEYRDFSRAVCERNAAAENVTNVRFEQGNAVKLDYADESFDAVVSNYVYHNIAGFDKQDLLLETLRVLKKGGIFAIHDLMSKARYGDMQKLVRKRKAEGYEEVYLIDTTDKFFRSPAEAKLLLLGGSTLLYGRK